ncbi:MAG: hypothetical protein ACE5G3_07170, partial [Gammaproteobacteria bacterium]
GALGCAESEASQSVLPDLARAHPAFAESRLARADPLAYRSVFEAAEQGTNWTSRTHIWALLY